MSSFRLRLALLVGTLTATLLLATGWISWQLTTRFNLDRLDRELRHLAHGNLDRVNDSSHWARLDAALAFISGSDRPRTYALWVQNYGHEEYRSPGWPAELRPPTLASPTTGEGAGAFTTTPSPPRRSGLSPANPPLPLREATFLTSLARGSTWRVAITGNPYTTLLLAANLDELNADLSRLRLRLLLALPIALVLVGAGAWWLAARALRPVQTLTAAAERVTVRGLDQRLALPGNDREFQRLVVVFNAMMDRLEKSFRQATRFSADASHELKTPLALLQGELEQALNTAPPGSPAAETYASLLDEVQRLKAIIQKLLLLSLADSGRLELHREPTDLAQLLANVTEDATALAPTLRIEPALPTRVDVLADATLLEQALQNLAANAIKYNRPDGLIRFALKTEPAARVATVTVCNTGPGITPADRPRVFERFYRGDRSRHRPSAASGVGLGLSLSREIIRAHGGDLTLSPARETGDWTEFVVTIPLAPPDASPHA